MNAYDVILAGVGAAGSAAAYHLARRGARVLALDRGTIPNDQSSHGGATRIIRKAYFEHPDYVPLLTRAYELWRDLERASGSRVLFTPGVLYAGPAHGPLVRGSLESAALHALRVESLSEAEAGARFPGFVIPAGHRALFEPEGGYLHADGAIRAHARLAVAHGAIVREREPVRRWAADSRGVTVETDHGIYAAASLVLCAGAWMPTLARLGVPLRVTKQTFAWFSPRATQVDGPPSTSMQTDQPVWAMEDADGSLYYGFPAGAGGEGVKAARHVPGEATDPDTPSREPETAEVERVAEFLRRRVPGAAGPMLRAGACLYTNSPDGHFVLGMHPAHARVIVASPCSGHGFKFASVMGEVLADLSLSGCSRWPVGFLSPKRISHKDTAG
ncbi:MAG: N-methyltryptophan oxidase [Phycisphaerae bacterium]|nr:MAG: N-methyltryptophan oxidase [Phycisphaerae bacterium]